jgi:hypothetical protein
VRGEKGVRRERERYLRGHVGEAEKVKTKSQQAGVFRVVSIVLDWDSAWKALHEVQGGTGDECDISYNKILVLLLPYLSPLLPLSLSSLSFLSSPLFL